MKNITNHYDIGSIHGAGQKVDTFEFTHFQGEEAQKTYTVNVNQDYVSVHLTPSKVDGISFRLNDVSKEKLDYDNPVGRFAEIVSYCETKDIPAWVIAEKVPKLIKTLDDVLWQKFQIE